MDGDIVPDKERPLAGVILCCTSILPEYREQLASIATQMGAVHKFDLTSDVTHLIVGDLNTPKYKYVAKERIDIKVLKPEWVEAVRSSWMLGGDPNLEELEEQYRYPTFAGLSICLTGFEDMNTRNHLQRTITENGGEFRRDLTKSVTHLIARSGCGQKYKYATLWKITVVSLKWLEDSLERGMALDESLYDPLMPDEEQGIGAWNRSAPVGPVKRPKLINANLQRPRKLRRVASIKLGGQNEDIWSNISGNAAKTTMTSDSFQSGLNDRGTDMLAVTSVSVIHEPKSFASETTVASRQAMDETKSVDLIEPRGKFLLGARFLIKGFSSSQTKILETHLLSRGAQLVTSLSRLAGDTTTNGPGMYVLVPYNLPRSEIPSLDDFVIEPQVVTDLWVEKCLHNNSLIPPESHITSTPFPRFPIPAFHGLRVCSTGFSGIDLLHLSKLVKVMGATYDEYLTSKASVLICNSTNPNQEKLRHVTEWNIPAVIADWLWISVQTGERKPFVPYIIQDKQPQKNGCPVHHIQQRKVKQDGSKKRSAPSENDTSSSPDSHTSKQAAVTTRRSEIEKQPETTRQPSIPPENVLPELPENSPRKRSRSPASSKSNKTPLLAIRVRSKTPPKIESNDKIPDPKTTLNVALNEFLKQKRKATSSKPSSLENKDSGDTGLQQQQQQQRKRRKQLFGSSSSHSSLLLGAAMPGDSHLPRANSIDTMNEDGCGSVVDGLGLDSPSTTKVNSNLPSFSSLFAENKKADKTEAQQLLESRLEMFRTDAASEFPGFEDEDDTPAMTQLGYEVPGVAAMRAKIASGNEGIADQGVEDGATGAVADATAKNRERAAKGLVLGKVKDHDLLAGWVGRRSMRRPGKGVGGL
ncbi:hypothetical protein PABG_05837 [Paracoccidioides brasiliensis Pb03]|nr:hypothetical protein PABG_05837 [Paracoccidioides brasiliensis Pb03]